MTDLFLGSGEAVLFLSELWSLIFISLISASLNCSSDCRDWTWTSTTCHVILRITCTVYIYIYTHTRFSAPHLLVELLLPVTLLSLSLSLQQDLVLPLGFLLLLSSFQRVPQDPDLPALQHNLLLHLLQLITYTITRTHLSRVCSQLVQVTSKFAIKPHW